MTKNDKTSDLARKLAPFITGMASDVSEETAIKEIEAVLQALEIHKDSSDHDNDPHEWTALNKFFQVLPIVGLLPLTQTADIGSVTNLFAKGYFAELSTLIFKKENVLVMDGTFVITKQSGKFPADVSPTDTQIDFGQTLTVGDFLLLCAEGKQEFMRVGALVEGTTYNVTRDLDGTGPNAWPAQSVYFVRGHQGDGWLELTATDDQRFSVFVQGADWNNTTEIGRFGKLDGWQGAGLTGYGIAVGNYATRKWIYYDTNSGQLISGGELQASNGNVIIGDNGVNIKMTEGWADMSRAVKYGDNDMPVRFFVGAAKGQFDDTIGVMKSFSKPGGTADVVVVAEADNGLARIDILATSYGKNAKIFGYANNFESKLEFSAEKMIFNNGELTPTPTANAIPKADATGKLDSGWINFPTPPDPVMAGLRRTSTQSIPRNTWTAIIWNAEDYDTGNFWTSGSAINIATAGVYNINTFIQFSGSTAQTFLLGVFRNAETQPIAHVAGIPSSTGIVINTACSALLAAGDKIYIKVFHIHSSNLNVLNSPSPRVHIERIGSGTSGGNAFVKGETDEQ